MISVTGGAGRRAQITTNSHGVMVDTRAVFRELVCGDFVCLHVFDIRVAVRTRRGDIQGMNVGGRIARGAQIMHAVTIGADGNLCIALGEHLSVHAGLILAELVGAQRRIVLTHESAVGMAAATKRRYLTSFDLAAEASGLAHRVHVRFGGIAAVTTRTGQALLAMDIV